LISYFKGVISDICIDFLARQATSDYPPPASPNTSL